MHMDLRKMRQNGEPMPPKNILLHHLRQDLERGHRNLQLRWQADFPPWANFPKSRPEDDPWANTLDFNQPLMQLNLLNNFNKTVPVFLFSEDRGGSSPLLRLGIFNHVYSRWFRPYRSEMDWCQFPVSMLNTSEPDPDARTAVSTAIWLNKILFNGLQGIVERTKTYFAEKTAAGVDLSPLQNHTDNPNYSDLVDELQIDTERHFQTWTMEDVDRFLPQPLFGALAIVLRSKEIPYKTIPNTDAADLPVWLVRTEVEDGLSAPISLDNFINQAQIQPRDIIGTNAVHTTFSKAFDFVMDLQAREITAFGPKPNPHYAATDRSRVYNWRGMPLDQQIEFSVIYPGFTPSDLPSGPSSAWVTGIDPDFDRRYRDEWDLAAEDNRLNKRMKQARESALSRIAERENKAADEAKRAAEWRWNKIDPNDLEDIEEVNAYWRKLELWACYEQVAFKAKERIRRKAWKAHKTPPAMPDPHSEPRPISEAAMEGTSKTTQEGDNANGALPIESPKETTSQTALWVAARQLRSHWRRNTKHITCNVVSPAVYIGLNIS